MAGIIKTIIEGILQGLDQMANDPAGPPQQRRVPQRAPAKQSPVPENAPNQTGLAGESELAGDGVTC